MYIVPILILLLCLLLLNNYYKSYWSKIFVCYTSEYSEEKKFCFGFIGIKMHVIVIKRIKNDYDKK